VLTACADPRLAILGQEHCSARVHIDLQQIAKLRGHARGDVLGRHRDSRRLGRGVSQFNFAKRCDIFLGLSDNGDDDALPGKLAFTQPYISLGYVLVVQGKAEGMKSLQELKDHDIKVGVSMTTPIDDYMFTNNIPRALYLAIAAWRGWSRARSTPAWWATAIAVAKQEFLTRSSHGGRLRAAARPSLQQQVRGTAKRIRAPEFVNHSIGTLLSNGSSRSSRATAHRSTRRSPDTHRHRG
jgi:hypothetical protein